MGTEFGVGNETFAADLLTFEAETWMELASVQFAVIT